MYDDGHITPGQIEQFAGRLAVVVENFDAHIPIQQDHSEVYETLVSVWMVFLLAASIQAR